MALQRLLTRGRVHLRRVYRNDQLVLAILAVLVGVAAAGGAILFRLGLSGVQFLFYGFGSETMASRIAALPWWHIVLAPTLGGLVVGLLLRYLMPGQRARAVPDVMEACALRGGHIPLRVGVGAAVVSAVSLGVGASTGREGPVVHLGATIGSFLGRRLGMSASLLRTLFGCGVASAVAASFNAPIAGVFFALEVVIGHYALSAFAPIVLASVMGTVVSRLYYGDFPAFVLPKNYEIVSFLEFPAFALLGVVSALVAGLFMWSVITAQDTVKRLDPPLVLRPAAAGLVLGLVALVFPQALGVGYEATDAALKEMLPLWLLLALIVLKTGATAISLGCGFGGGVFSPALFVGAMTGGAFGLIATGVFPDLSSGHGAYTLVGMGAVAGAVLGAPISTILIVFEMSGDYALTIALMVAVVIASTLIDQVLGKSLFTWQLERRGIVLEGGREVALLRQVRVSHVMKRDYAAIDPSADWDEVHERLRTARYGELLVLGDANTLIGVITLVDLAEAEAHAADGADPDAPVHRTAAALARPDPPMLEAADDIRAAMRLMDQAGESHIAVVDDREARHVVGFVHEHDVMLAYHRALMQARAEERGEAVRQKDRSRV